MAINPTVLEIAGYVSGLLFPFWPALLLEALAGGGRDVLKPMMITWAAFLVTWFFATIAPSPRMIRIIPPPYNTDLFFITGAILALIYLIRAWRGES
jgi:hypothetical protein